MFGLGAGRVARGVSLGVAAACAFAWALGCASGVFGPPGELWLQVEATSDDGNRVTLTVPATTLRDDGEPAMLETADGDVDLRPVARDLRVGDEAHWTLADGSVATLRDEAAADPDAAVATEVAMGLTGKNGKGLTMSLPITPKDLTDAQNRASLDVHVGLPVAFDDAGCAQLLRSAPRPILEIVGPKGNGFRVATR